MFPYIIQGSNITVVIGSTPHTVSKSHPTYQKLVDAIKANDEDTVRDLIEPKKVILNYGQGNVAIQGEKLFWKDIELHNTITTKLVQMLQEGFPIDPLVAFMDNLMHNPSKRAVDELYGFLEKGQLPITSDGHFLAYKRVKDDYRDVHSGTVLNCVASGFSAEDVAAMPLKGGKKKEVRVFIEDGVTVVETNRNFVDDDANSHCSEGLHFCSKDYLSCFGGDRIMILKINPRDVVSIPNDYSYTKGRCCRYAVIGELGVNPDDAFTAPVQDQSN